MVKSKAKKLKIAIFHLAFVYSGGGERLVLEEAIGLEKLGYDVTCFSPVVDRKGCFPELLSRVKVKRILPKILPSWYPDVELVSILMACLLVPLLFFKFRNYDFYFGANQPGPWMAFILSKINRIPYGIYLAQPTRMVHPRLIDQKTGLKINDGFSLINFYSLIFKPIIKYLDSKSIQSARTIFANGSYAKGLLEEVYNIETINCPAGAHIKEKISNEKIMKRFTGSIGIDKKTIKKPYVLITNRHFPQKKFEFAIEALFSMGKNCPNLVIAGKDTDYTKWLKKHYKKNKIYFTGLLSESDLDRAYRNAAVYVYPAPEEDFGMGIIEAMAYGVPVVAWGNAGPTGIIKHQEDGLLAKPFSVKDFSNNIMLLLNNRRLYKRISKNAYGKVISQFTYEIHNSLLHRHIKRVLNKRN